jgi:hypothetical protein
MLNSLSYTAAINASSVADRQGKEGTLCCAESRDLAGRVKK